MGSYEGDFQFNVGPQHDNHFVGGDNFRGPGIREANKFDKKVDAEYEGYYLEKLEPLRTGERANWSRVSQRKVPLSAAQLSEVSKKQRKESRLSPLEAFENLSKDQQSVINRLIDTKEAKDPVAIWRLNCVRKYVEKNYRTRTKETKRILVIVKREPRSTIKSGFISGARGNSVYRDGDVIDLADPTPRPMPKNNDITFGLGGGLGGGKNFNNSGPPGFGIGLDNIVGEGPNNGMGKTGGKKQNVDNLGPGGLGIGPNDVPIGTGKTGKKGNKKNKAQGQFDGIGEHIMNEQPQVVGPFPDPFAGVSLDDKFPPPPPPNHDPSHQEGRSNQPPPPNHQPFPQQHPPHPQPFPQHQQGPPAGAIRADDWPPQPPPMHHQPPPMHDQFPPLRDAHLPHDGNPFQPHPHLNKPGGFDFPPTLLNNDPHFGGSRSPPRPRSQHRRRSPSARRPLSRSIDDPNFIRKVSDWTLNDPHSSDESYRDDIWSNPPRDRDSRRSFTPPSSPDYFDESRGRGRGKRNGGGGYRERLSDRDLIEPSRGRNREYDLIEPVRGRRRHSPGFDIIRPKRLGLQRALTDYPSGPVVAEFRPPYRDEEFDIEYAGGRERRHGKYHHQSQRRRREGDWDFEERDRRGGRRRASGFW